MKLLEKMRVLARVITEIAVITCLLFYFCLGVWITFRLFQKPGGNILLYCGNWLMSLALVLCLSTVIWKNLDEFFESRGETAMSLLAASFFIGILISLAGGIWGIASLFKNFDLKTLFCWGTGAAIALIVFWISFREREEELDLNLDP